MIKALKIFGWTLFGMVITVIAAVCIVVYVVFTPERLTPIARQAAAQFITCEHEIGEVDLTFFSTFPRFGLRADGLMLVNPKEGTPNDTVVVAPHVVATVDVMEFLNNGHIHVHELSLSDARVCFYIAPDGSTNLSDVFVSSPDTTAEDTTASEIPYQVSVDGIRLHAQQVLFKDDKDTIAVALSPLALEAQVQADLSTMHFDIVHARLLFNEFALGLHGTADLQEVIALHVGLETEKAWPIRPLLALVPDKFAASLSDLDIDGNISLHAEADGIYSDTSMPLIRAHVALTDGKGAYKPLPYTLRDMELEADAVLDLNEGQSSDVTIHRLAAQTKNSRLAAKGNVENLLGDMALDLQMNLDANLPDFAYFLPKAMTLTGRTKGAAEVQIHLSDLTRMRLHKGKIRADLDMSRIHYAMDSMIADLPKTHATICIPNEQPSQPKLNWARIDLETDQVDFEMAMPLTAKLKSSAIQLEAGNVLSDDPVLYAAVGLQSDRPLEMAMDSMGATIDAPQLYAYAEYNTKDTTGLQIAQASLQCDGLDGFFRDITVDMRATQLKAFVSGGKKVKAQLNTKALTARVGDELKAKTASLALEAGARYNKHGENELLKWNPRLKIDLKEGELEMPARLPETVYIPSIEFSYSNREMNIDNSRIELGNSDLNIKGNVRNIGKWFRHKDILQGELEIVSEHCDANQLLAWFSADSGSEENLTDEADPTADRSNSDNGPTGESDPFLVPTDVDLALHTHMQEVKIFNQVANDLKGGLFVKNGTLILDEMGFVCRAAKLQLTAMYRTPRRNHLYLGLDYHMIDVDIDELLTMIPNLEQMVPMLSSFKGAAAFHLAAETYLNSQYQPKMSTLRGAASLTAKDLVVLDGETFDQIAKLLRFKKKTENKIDSINAELTVYKKEIDVYPLCVQMDNYMVALGGRHNTDMTFDYDINVLSPIYLGVNVSGNLDDLKIKLAKCKFAQDFKPHWYQKADTQSRELRERIKQSMEKNVRIQ